MSAERPKVAVLGSVNLDISLRVERLPLPGETVRALNRAEGLGGKGANQAVAAALAGSDAAFLGAVGSDQASGRLLERMNALGVDTSHVMSSPEHEPGRATITVDADGQNCIVFEPGANAAVTSAFVRDRASAVRAAEVLVLQCEISPGAIREAIAVAAESHTRVVLNLAPFLDLGPGIADADPLVVNAVEAAQQLNTGPLIGPGAALKAATELVKTSRSAVITLGPAGAVVASREGTEQLPATEVGHVVDTTGAGDAFVGVLAAQLATGKPLAQAARLAVHAAGLSVQYQGAAEGYPRFDRALSASVGLG